MSPETSQRHLEEALGGRWDWTREVGWGEHYLPTRPYCGRDGRGRCLEKPGHFRQIRYCLSHQGSPRILEWVAYPFSRGTSQPRN